MVCVGSLASMDPLTEVGAQVGEADGATVAVAVAVGDGVPVAVAVAVAVGVGVPPQPTGTSVMLSIRTPLAPAAATLLSLAARHFSWMFCPLAAAGRFTFVVM